MYVSKYTIYALIGLLLSSLYLELAPQPHDELVTECCAWLLILLVGKLGFTYYFPSAQRSFNGAELTNIAFGAILLCLSYSFKSTTWSLAPLLCLVVLAIENKSPYLPIHSEPKGEPIEAKYATKKIAIVGTYALVTTAILIGSDATRSDFRLKICWLFAQGVLYWALSRRFGEVKEVEPEPDHIEEAFRTATELAPYMAIATAPLAALWWSGPPAFHSASFAAILKACRWISILVLANESKISVLPWATAYVVCTKGTWEFDLIAQSGLSTLGALVALYRAATTFPQSDRRKRIVLACGLFPLLAFVYQNGYTRTPPWQRGPSGILTITRWDKSEHPIAHLAEEARARFAERLSCQSQSLSAATAEYSRRYGRSPPPGFDGWYNWAVENNVQFIDEYDMMTKSFDVFWRMPPKVLKGYIDQALSAKMVNTLEVKGHEVRLSKGSFQHRQLVQLVEPIAKFLPDFTAVLNEADEPRVLPPHDMTCGEPKDHSDGPEEESQPIFFEDEGHQNIWSSITLPCSPDSRARAPLIEPKIDYAFPSFTSNLSQSQDLCSWSASGSHHHGFLSSPSTFDYTHSLVPMLATARMSTFRDILMPSSYYFQDDIYEHEEEKDTTWEEKKDVVYWRGTGTGGYWHGGSWRQGHRQRFVDFTTSPEGQVRLMKETKPGHWDAYRGRMGDVIKRFEVNFTNFIQCDADDCRQQEEFFHKAERDAEGNSHQYKVLYNLDGNSFSGRYYRYLKSNSLVFMQALFQEWHDDRIVPWVHFVPISVNMQELPETARYLLEDPAGKVVAKRIADDSREWARKILRPIDLTAAYYRAFLEFVRLVDDNRETMA